ncbi:unnamed protein product, partial [Didymodactylos carnosus]
STSQTTTTATVLLSYAYYSFDNNVNDSYNNFNGVVQNGPVSYVTGYVPTGQAIVLNPSSQSQAQSILITNFLNFAYASFTVEVWVYPLALNSGVADNAIIGQCQCNTCTSQCLYLVLRNKQMRLGFYSNDIQGGTSLTTGNWYHLAYVYNYATQQEVVYINGYQDTIGSGHSPYLGMNGTLQIGTSQILLPSNFFQG